LTASKSQIDVGKLAIDDLMEVSYLVKELQSILSMIQSMLEKADENGN